MVINALHLKLVHTAPAHKNSLSCMIILVATETEFNSGSAYTPFNFSRTFPLIYHTNNIYFSMQI